MKLLRRGTALVLSLLLVFSLVAVVATPNWSDTTSLGLLSRYYETGKTNTDEKAAGMISTVVGDPGGKSFGAYMFTIKSGTVMAFINWCRNPAINAATSVEYAIGDALYTAYTTGGTGFGPLFDQTWTSLAEPAPVGYGSAFFRAQEAFSKTNIYDVAIDMIKATPEGANFDINDYSVALKNVIWSRAVHHGPKGASEIVAKAFASLGGFAHQSESDIIMAIYKESGRTVTPAQLSSENGATAATMQGSTAAKYNVDGEILRYWYGSSAGVQEAVYRRLNVNEPSDALRILQNNALSNASIYDGNYTVTLQIDSSTLALGVTGSSVKVVNTAGTDAGTPAKFTLNYLAGVGTTGAYTISTTVTDENNQPLTMRLAASTVAGSNVGEVTLALPSYSHSQLWYIDNDGNVINKATGTYLSYQHDKLVVVGADGVETSQAVAVTADGEATNRKAVTGQTSSGEEDSNAPKAPTVTYVADEFGAFKTDENLVLASTTAEDITTYTLGTLPTLTPIENYTFNGWFTADGTEAVTAETAVPSEGLTLYAKYTRTVTSTVSRAKWSFSPVVASAADFTVNQLIYPDENTELRKGDSGFPVRGMISCSGTISRVDLTITGTTNLHDYATPNAHYYDLGEMDSSIKYSQLEKGETYAYKLTATVDNNVYVLKESTFSVGAPASSGSGSSSTPSGDIVTVTFNAGTNGKCTTTSQTYSLDSVIYNTLPDVTPNNGYGFAGWFTAPTGGVQVLPGTQIVAENITLYAQYTRKYTYTFTGATGSNASGLVAAGTIFYAPSSSNAPWKGPDANYIYEFSHWVDSKNNKYSSGQAIIMGEGDVTFTPIFTQTAYGSTSPSNPTNPPPSSGNNNGGSGGGGGGTATTTPSGPMLTMVPGMTVSQVNGTVYSGGKVVTSGALATGMTVKSGGSEFVISVTGDASGDGRITVTDVVKVQSHLLNKASLSGAYLKAADLTGDGKVTITDLVKSARVVAGKDKIG